MTLRSLFFGDSAQIIRSFYSYHNQPISIRQLEDILNRSYDVHLGTDVRGNTRLLLPIEYLEYVLQFVLGRTAWVLPIANKKAHVVYFSELGVISKQIDAEIFEEKGCVVEGCCLNKNEFHVLRAYSTSRCLLNYKRFKKILRAINLRYSRITATCATCPDIYVGEEDDWRFKNSENGNRLLSYWRKIGLKSDKKDKWKLWAGENVWSPRPDLGGWQG